MMLLYGQTLSAGIVLLVVLVADVSVGVGVVVVVVVRSRRGERRVVMFSLAFAG